MSSSSASATLPLASMSPVSSMECSEVMERGDERQAAIDHVAQDLAQVEDCTGSSRLKGSSRIERVTARERRGNVVRCRIPDDQSPIQRSSSGGRPRASCSAGGLKIMAFFAIWVQEVSADGYHECFAT